MSETNTHHSIIIVGSGPAGYTAGIYAARAGLNPVIIAGSVDAGGALMNTTEVENYPGFVDGIMGPDLMDNMRAQAERFGAHIVDDDAVEIVTEGEVKEVTTGEGDKYTGDALILAMGSQHRKLGVPGEDAMSGRGVSWCATCDAAFYRDKTVAVVGGGDSAVEEALFLTKFASKVTLIHRRDELRASKIMAERLLSNPKIEVFWNTEVAEVVGEKVGFFQKMTGLQLAGDHAGLFTVDGLFIAVGHDPRTELIADKITIHAGGNVYTHNGTYTTVEGVFACGDLVDGKYQQAITAAGSGCAAALDAQHWLENRDIKLG